MEKMIDEAITYIMVMARDARNENDNYLLKIAAILLFCAAETKRMLKERARDGKQKP